jgi:hypothetical protein
MGFDFDSIFFRCHISVNAVLIEAWEALIAATVAHATFSSSSVRMSRVEAMAVVQMLNGDPVACRPRSWQCVWLRAKG